MIITAPEFIRHIWAYFPCWYDSSKWSLFWSCSTTLVRVHLSIYSETYFLSNFCPQSLSFCRWWSLLVAVSAKVVIVAHLVLSQNDVGSCWRSLIVPKIMSLKQNCQQNIIDCKAGQSHFHILWLAVPLKVSAWRAVEHNGWKKCFVIMPSLVVYMSPLVNQLVQGHIMLCRLHNTLLCIDFLYLHRKMCCQVKFKRHRTQTIFRGLYCFRNGRVVLKRFGMFNLFRLHQYFSIQSNFHFNKSPQFHSKPYFKL